VYFTGIRDMVNLLTYDSVMYFTGIRDMVLTILNELSNGHLSKLCLRNVNIIPTQNISNDLTILNELSNGHLSKLCLRNV
jgi:hypothetical protein